MDVRSKFTLVAALVVVAATAQAAPIPVTSCDATIPAGKVGVLQNDLTCRHFCAADPSVECQWGDEEEVCLDLGGCRAQQIVLQNGARLELAGHTIHMAIHGDGVSCTGSSSGAGRCTVVGPGTFAGEKGTAIVGGARTDLVVKDVAIGRCDWSIFTRGRLRANGLVILNDRENTVFAERGIRLRQSQIAGDYGVVTDGDLHVRDVEVSASGGLFVAGAVRGEDLHLSRTARVEARSISLRRVTATPEADYPQFAPLLSAEGALRLADSTVVDIESGRKPVLVRSTCVTSTVFGGSESWGVCSGD